MKTGGASQAESSCFALGGRGQVSVSFGSSKPLRLSRPSHWDSPEAEACAYEVVGGFGTSGDGFGVFLVLVLRSLEKASPKVWHNGAYQPYTPSLTLQLKPRVSMAVATQRAGQHVVE